MAAQFCSYKLGELEQLVQHYGTSALAFCVMNFVFSLVATLGNLSVIHALWKASSISATIKKFFLSLAFSDLAVGLFVQLMYGVIIAAVLRMAANGDYTFDLLCPTSLTVFHFSMFLLACASFLNLTAIAVDRLLAISLHLRYQELVTSKRVVMALMSLWFTSVAVASLYSSLPSHNDVVIGITGFLGTLVTTVSYIRIYKVVRYHQNQIHSLQQLNAQATELLREKKIAFNTLCVYVVFLACYLPNSFAKICLSTNRSRLSFLLADYITVFLVLLNSSLNPIVYCWRYREIRNIAFITLKKILHINDSGA